MAHALASADARRGWVHPSRIDDRHGHHVLADRCNRGCTHRQPQDDGVTEQRLHESQDVLITSSYVANDVQSAASVNVNNATTDCAGAFTTLVTFTYASAAHPNAVYQCGTANGETQVTRTFNNGTPIVVAHFAGTARPTVTVAYDIVDAADPDVGHDAVHEAERLHARLHLHPLRLSSQLQPGLRDDRWKPAARPTWCCCRPASRARCGCKAVARTRGRRSAASSIQPRRPADLRRCDERLVADAVVDTTQRRGHHDLRVEHRRQEDRGEGAPWQCRSAGRRRHADRRVPRAARCPAR